MSGKRLLDAARLYGAFRSVARTHFAIRSQQLDTFSKTSSLAKAVKSQTDRVTVTAGAAYALARRLSETGPAYNVSSGGETHSTTSSTSTGDTGPLRSTNAEKSVGGLEQDHHYKRSEDNAVRDEEPRGSIDVTQEKAKRYPLPDGTIPPQGSPIGSPSPLGKDTISERVREAPQDPLAHNKQAELDVEQKQSERDPLTDGSIPPKHAPIGKGPEVGGEDTYAERPDPEPRKSPLAQQHKSEPELEPRESGETTIPDPSFAARKAQQLSEMQIPSESAMDEPGATGPDTFVDRPRTTSTTLSSLPRSKIPKNAETSEGSETIQGQKINQDVYYSPSPDAKRDSMTDADVPEGVDLNVFHSPQVASLINSGGREDRRKAYETRMNAARQKAGVQNVAKTSSAAADQADSFPPQRWNAGPLWGEGDVVRDESDRVFNPDKAEDAEAKDTRDLADSLAAEAKQQQTEDVVAAEEPISKHQLHESRVPSSRLGRIWQFSGLATSMAFGAVGETFRRVTGGSADGSIMLSEANMDRLVNKLSRMRGAALKLGQMMSFQDSKMLPPAINAVLARVQDSADYMPRSQRDKVLASNLGDNWRDLYSSFDDVPIAAASIGQVHKAVLTSGEMVAVKVQYPGVRDSITSDLNNLSLLLTASRLLPKGLYLDKTIANAKTELAWECDYLREAQCGKRFASLCEDERDIFTVPKVFTDASGPEVLTAEFMSGSAVTKIKDLSQSERDWIGTQILRLCLRELMEWRFMQTDPNWTNFLYNRESQKLELLDFGASREYPEEFVKPYVELLIAASKKDRETCRDKSVQLGYLTGQESKAMLTAHVDSILTLAEPFMEDAELAEGGVYDFRDQTITDRVRSKIGVMVRERLAPPPEETYSLHRKLSGAFLLCARLGSRVQTRDMFSDAVGKWKRR